MPKLWDIPVNISASMSTHPGRSINDVTFRTGRVNGRGFVNGSKGYVNGRSMVNGRGFVNGSKGYVNGRSMVNGRGFVNGIQGSFPRGQRRGGYRVGVAIAVFLLIISFLFVYSYYIELKKAAPINVDARLYDWGSIPTFKDSIGDVSEGVIDIKEFSVYVYNFDLYFYIKTSSAIPKNGRYGYFLFIDSDSNRTSGYEIQQIGAEYMIRILVSNGEVLSSAMYHISGSEISYCNFIYEKNIAVSIEKNVIEGAVPQFPYNAFGAIAVASTDTGIVDFSDEIATLTGSFLNVNVKYVTPYLISSEKSTTMILMSFNGNAKLSKIIFTIENEKAVGKIYMNLGEATFEKAFSPVTNKVEFVLTEPIDLQKDMEARVYVYIQNDSDIEGTVFGLFIDNVVIEEGYVRIIEHEVLGRKGYIDSSPMDIQIDGAFGEWTLIDSKRDKKGDCAVADIDILETKVTTINQNIYLYFNVDGVLLRGDIFPMDIGATIESLKKPPQKPSVKEKIIRIPRFVGTDHVVINITGYPIFSIISPVHYTINILGRNGEIYNAEMRINIAGKVTKNLAFEYSKDEDEMELMIAKGFFNNMAKLDLDIHIYSYMGASDSAVFSSLVLTSNKTYQTTLQDFKAGKNPKDKGQLVDSYVRDDITSTPELSDILLPIGITLIAVAIYRKKTGKKELYGCDCVGRNHK